MSLPAGASVLGRVGGGDINEAYRVLLPGGTQAFVKTRPDPAPGEYAVEAAALGWLAEAGGLPTPGVLDVQEGHLALEWIPEGGLDGVCVEELGRGLARTHLAGAPSFGAPPGIDPDAAGFGTLRLSNAPAPDWPSFYAERRLLPLAKIALARGALSSGGARAVEGVCEALGELAGPPEPPARLHGDLWSGNVLTDRTGRPWLIDPAAYGGHREVDLAMLRLFGGPGESRAFGAYQEIAPLADGWEERVELYQLLPLLVHAVLFGGSYGSSAERAARRYVG